MAPALTRRLFDRHPHRHPGRHLSPLVVATALILAAACAPAPAAAPPVAVPPVTAPPTRAVVFPLATSVAFSDSFGAGRSGGRSHEGQDLMAPKGTVAVAAAAGTVSYLKHSSDGLSGNMLRITDAEGWQYVYIHLNNDSPGTDDGANRFEQAFADGMRVGQRVLAGEPVGYVGDSGNAESTGAHLHFELRSPDGLAVNADSSLRAAPVAPRSAEQLAAAAPVGVIDGVGATSGGSVRVHGWALDRLDNTPVVVSVYVDGNPRGTTTADGDRPDLAAEFPDRGAGHGFDVTVAGIASGERRVCVVAHNSGPGGGSSRLGCAAVQIG